jgi:hypothetical protein
LRSANRRKAPRQLLIELVEATLEAFRSQFTGCPLHPAFSVWKPDEGGQMMLCAANSVVRNQVDSHGPHPWDSSSSIWQTYSTAKVSFQRRQSTPSMTIMPVQAVAGSSWLWRLSLPILDYVDSKRVAAVLCVEGDGHAREPRDLAPFEIAATGARLVTIVRPAISALDRYD